MEETHFLITEILNCLSWLFLTIAFIVVMFKIAKGHIEVKNAIKNKIEAETRRINERY